MHIEQRLMCGSHQLHLQCPIRIEHCSLPTGGLCSTRSSVVVCSRPALRRVISSDSGRISNPFRATVPSGAAIDLMCYEP